MLVPCQGCGRHVRDDEGTCPFCSRARRRIRRRVAKVGLAGAAGIAMMTIGIGCAYGMPEEPPNDAGPDADAGLEDAPDATQD